MSIDHDKFVTQESAKKWIDRSIFGRLLRLLKAKGTIKAKLEYLSDWAGYGKMLQEQGGSKDLAGKRHEFPAVKFKPYLTEKYASSGSAGGQYFFQDLYVARKIFEANPVKHLDIGSRIDGFVTHVASFRKIEVGDIRESESKIDGVTFRVVDITDPNKIPEGYCDSLSCLHTVEHIGLGRYGDKIDPKGHVSAVENLVAAVKEGGRFYISVPIGPQRLEFNEKRVFCPSTMPFLVEKCRPSMKLVDFAYVDDDGALHQGFDVSESLPSGCYGCYYGLGIYTFEDQR